MDSERIAKADCDPETQQLTKNTAQGSATSIWAAVGDVWEGKGGKYLENCSVAAPDDGVPKNSGYNGYKTYAYEETNETKLWEDSLELFK